MAGSVSRECKKEVTSTGPAVGPIVLTDQPVENCGALELHLLEALASWQPIVPELGTEVTP